MKQTRRGFLGTIAALSTAAASPQVGMAESAPEHCADCAMILEQGPVPETFLPVPTDAPYMDLARQSVHEVAAREQISHAEAAITVYWQAFPTYTVEPSRAVRQP